MEQRQHFRPGDPPNTAPCIDFESRPNRRVLWFLVITSIFTRHFSVTVALPRSPLSHQAPAPYKLRCSEALTNGNPVNYNATYTTLMLPDCLHLYPLDHHRLPSIRVTDLSFFTSSRLYRTDQNFVDIRTCSKCSIITMYFESEELSTSDETPSRPPNTSEPRSEVLVWVCWML